MRYRNPRQVNHRDVIVATVLATLPKIHAAQREIGDVTIAGFEEFRSVMRENRN